MNQVILVGNLGKEPEYKLLDNDKKVVKFSLATNEKYTTKSGETKTDTQWHNVIAWGNIAQFCNDKLNKGNEVMVKGKLTNNSYEDQEGKRIYFTQIVANYIKPILPLSNDKKVPF